MTEIAASTVDRPRFRVRLQTLVVLWTTLIVVVGLVAREFQIEHQKKRIAGDIRRLGGSVVFARSMDTPKYTGVVNGWLRLILGDDYFSRADRINLSPRTHKELSFLGYFPELRHLFLADPSVETSVFPMVRKMSDLESLLLKGIKLSEADLDVVASLSNLTYLGFDHCTLPDNFPDLAELPKLATLSFEDCELPDTLCALTGLPMLQELRFTNCRLPDTSWQLLGDHKLRNLRFHSCSLSDRDYESLGTNSGLKSLELTLCETDESSLEQLYGAPSRLELTLKTTQVNERDLLRLSEANPGWAIKHDAYRLPRRSELAEIPELSYSGSFVTGVTLQALRDAKNIHYLSLSNCKINDQDLQHLHGLESLENLSLTGGQLTDCGVRAWVTTLPKLRTLKLVQIAVSGDCLQHLPSELTELSICYMNITNAEIAAISTRQTSLKSFSLLACPSISDECIPDLGSMRCLEHLTLEAMELSEAGTAQLQQSLPACKIHLF